MTKQCKACPWKKSTAPGTDIPGGYSAEKHRALKVCQADGVIFSPTLRMMACHESGADGPRACVGWVVNQLGPGNNIPLRIAAMSGEFNGYKTVGPQHTSLDAMCATAGRKR